MAWGPLSNFQVAKSLTTNASLTTSPPWFTGDWRLTSVSCSTQSNTGLVIQQSDEDGFQSPIPENSWANVLSVTGLGSTTSTFALPYARWSRSSSQAASNGTIIFAGRS